MSGIDQSKDLTKIVISLHEVKPERFSPIFMKSRFFWKIYVSNWHLVHRVRSWWSVLWLLRLLQNWQLLCKGWKCGWFTGCHNGCVPSFWFYSFQPASQTSLSWISVSPWVYYTIYFYQLLHIPNSFCWQSLLSYQRLCFAEQLEAVYLQKLVWH